MLGAVVRCVGGGERLDADCGAEMVTPDIGIIWIIGGRYMV
jgi:hypothetical protein